MRQGSGSRNVPNILHQITGSAYEEPATGSIDDVVRRIDTAVEKTRSRHRDRQIVFCVPGMPGKKFVRVIAGRLHLSVEKKTPLAEFRYYSAKGGGRSRFSRELRICGRSEVRPCLGPYGWSDRRLVGITLKQILADWESDPLLPPPPATRLQAIGYWIRPPKLSWSRRIGFRVTYAESFMILPVTRLPPRKDRQRFGCLENK